METETKENLINKVTSLVTNIENYIVVTWRTKMELLKVIYLSLTTVLQS